MEKNRSEGPGRNEDCTLEEIVVQEDLAHRHIEARRRAQKALDDAKQFVDGRNLFGSTRRIDEDLR